MKIQKTYSKWIHEYALGNWSPLAVLLPRVDPVPRHSFNRQYVPVYDIPFKKIQTRREYVGEMFLLGTQLSLKNAPAAV